MNAEETGLLQNAEKMDLSVKGQAEYTALLHTVLGARYGSTPRAFVHTYGCQGNVADGERIKGMLAEMGYTFTDTVENADLVLYNTCAVREHAEDRVFGNVGALKNRKAARPGMVVALCGCMMQQPRVAEKIRRSYSFVDLVFGTHVIHRLPELLYRALCGRNRVFELPDEAGSITEGLPVVRDSSFKAFLPVMYGCNNFCSYCIVPYVRGRERSRMVEAVLEEARSLVEAGYRDITLLGQNVNSYGKDLETPVPFAQLLREINAIPGDFRIRFMTSHPKDCTRELLDAMADCEKVAKHLHLPFQSGNDRVLKEMNRRYTREQYLELARYARKVMPALSLTSDVIVGFPGETYEEFQDTLSLVEEVGFTSLFTFIFSPREGTPAAKMPDPVSREEKGKWFRELTDLQERIAGARNQKLLGRRFRVLVEGPGKKEGLLAGRTEGNLVIEFPGGDSLIGEFVEVVVTEALAWILRGQMEI